MESGLDIGNENENIRRKINDIYYMPECKMKYETYTTEMVSVSTKTELLLKGLLI